jgi:hypothetical protein
VTPLTAQATLALALGTVALAIVSLIALLVTHADTRVLIKQTRLASDQQHIDTLTALRKTDATITAMKTQADIMRGQLDQMRSEGRAWVSIEPFLGNVTWNKDGVSINLKFTMKNTGKLPAFLLILMLG